MISGSTRLAAVIGSPVAHSLSPAIHNAAFSASELDWRFVAFEVAPGDAMAAVTAMKTLRISGLAITAPHKRDAAIAVDEVDAAGCALESVNTVLLRADGSTFGASTDGAGFVESVCAAGIDLIGLRVAVLGAGGAARSVVDALGRAGVVDIAIINRRRSSAVVAAALSDVARVGSTDDIEGAGLLVNTTSVGMGTDESPLDGAHLRAELVVADIVYHPLETALLRAARAAGSPTLDGLGMLIHQAVLQQQLWTGVRPDPDVMRAAATAELERRSERARVD